jgi:hypothetical protein
MINTENWNDKDFVLEKVKQDGWALQYASEELQNDKEVALEAIINDWDASKYVSFKSEKNN